MSERVSWDGISKYQSTAADVALQRIAVALEKIIDLLDPVNRKKLEQEAEYQEARSGRLEKWHLSYGARRRFMRKAKAVFHPLNPDAKHRSAVNIAMWRALGEIEGMPCNWDEFDPTEEFLQDRARRLDSFDPATFDWGSVTLTPLMRSRLNTLLAQLAAT